MPVDVRHKSGTSRVVINQKLPPEIDDGFCSLGCFDFDSDGKVTIANQGTDGHVIIDAVQFLTANRKVAPGH